MPFKKGKIPEGAKPFNEHPENINKEGRPRKLPELEILLAEALSDAKDGHTAAEAVIMALRKKAIGGDVRAIELILNRAYGKQVEKFEGTVTNVEMPKIIIERDPD
jgi:hypothetical protein